MLMKDKFLSKSVPRGTRTIWRYLGALFILFTFAVGNVWGAYDVPADGTLTLSQKVNNGGRFNVEASGVYHFRTSSGYSWDSSNGIKTQSNEGGVVFYLDASKEIEVGIVHTEAKNAHEVTVHVYSITESVYKQFDDNKAGAAESNRTFSTTPTSSTDGSFTISITAESKTFTGKKTLAAGYYAVVPVGEKNKTFFKTIKFTTTGGGTDVCPSGISITGEDEYTEGDKIELTAALTAGNGDISYQWYKGSVAPANAISGATTNKLTISSCAVADAGNYYCVASKTSCDDAVSSAFAITVAAAPVIEPTGTATISYALSGSTTTGTVTGVNSISGLSSSLTLSTLTLSGTKDGYSGAIKGCTSTTELVEADYVDVQFTVGSGYVFTPSAVTVQVNPFTATGAVKAVVKVMDAQPLVVASEELSCAKSTDNAVTFASGAFTNKKFEGTVHLRMYFYGPASEKTFYLKSPISITGTVAVAPTKYNVNFDKNDEGAGGSQTTLKYEAGAEVTLPACTFEAPTGKEFDAWTSTDVTISDGKFTMPSNAVTIKATWKALTTKYTVTYKEGETTLGSEEVTIGGSPVNAGDYDDKDLASFVGWYNNSDLAEEHKIADIAALVVTKDTTVYGKWTPAYASSINIEQWVLDNGVNNTPFRAELTARNYQYTSLNNLDSLNDDPNKDYRNYAYLGQKVNKTDSEIKFLLKSGSTLNVRFGHIGTPLNVVIGSAEPVELTSAEYANDAPGDKKYTYTATEDVIVKFQTTGTSTCVFKQIMIDEEIQNVILPAIVTLDANGGTYTDASVKYTGTPLVIGDATPADEYHVFAGWFDGDDQIDATAYVPTKNVTLQAHYAPKPYSITYMPNGGTGAEYIIDDNATVVRDCPVEFIAPTGKMFYGWKDGEDNEVAVGAAVTSNLVLYAQWGDIMVAKIGETMYPSLEAALLHAADGEIVLLQDIDVTAQVEVEAGVTAVIDLAGHKIEYIGTETLPSGVILVHNGANLTIDDSSDPDAGSIVAGEKAYAAIALTKAGDDAANPAVLVINGGIFTGYYYGITGNGSRPNTQITINGGTITATATNDNLGIYHPQDGTLTVNGGTITAYASAIEMRAGTLVINGGTFTATASEFSCNPNGSGTTTVGAAIAIAQHTTKTDIVVTIKGGTFEGEKAINESNPQANDPAPQVDLAVTGGDFTGEVSTVDVDHFISGGSFDAPVSNENCAEGFVPSPLNPVTGKYSVEPKDGVSIIKATINSTTKNTIGEVTGLYKKDASCGGLSSYKFNGKGAYIGIELVAGQTFNEGDIINIHTTSAAGQGTIALYNDHGNTVSSFHDYGVMGGTGDNKFALPASAEDKSIIYVCRTEANTWNGYVDYIEVTRAMNPLLTAITIDERAGVIDPLDDKHFNVQIPYEADLANLTIVPTIAWNAPAAENSIVVNDGGAWVEGNNTYKLTDKDGDYTIYTLTLTRDVLKHTVSFNTHGGSAVASELVVDGESLEAAPAAPEKEDYLFQGWAETDGGAIVDVTTFAISADKEFHAVWAPDGALKLINKTSGVVNEDGYFITGVTATEANSEKAAAWGGTQGATISGTNQLGKIVQYNATTNQTKLQIKVYNTNNSDKYVYIHKIIEGNTTEETVETLTATSKTVVTSEYYEFNNTKNRSFYITTNSTDVKILQVKVIESGETPMKKAGEAGYSLNLNKGRALYYANSDVTLEGLGLQSASNYNVISSTEFQTTKNFSFSISTPVLLKVTTNTAKYYVSQDPNEDGTTATAVTDAGTAEFNLTTTGTWYLVPSTTSNVKYTNIAFELPKAATPVIETQPATNHTFNPGDMTATVVATVSEGTLHYQWYKKATVGDDEEVGTDAATLTTTTEGTYYVVVTNVLAGHQDVSVTSEEAELGYRVTNDATLMALSYGGTAITLEDGVYNYNVELAKGTTDVPALAATATMDGYADVDINDAAEFVNYEASSTVTVKSEDLTETNVYTVNFYVKHDLPQVDVTATTVWNWANAATTMQTIKPATKNVEQLMANIDDEGKQLKNDADFNSQALIFSGQEALTGNSTRWYAKGGHIKFNVTVPGIVEVEFSDNGDNNRRIKINNAVSTVASANNTDVKTYKAYVQPGEVTLMGVKNDGTGEDQYIRISKITFTANPTPDYTRTVSNNIGTLCVDHNVLVGGALGATFYQIASRNEQYNDKIDFEEVLPNEELKAGEPYIFKSTTGRIDLFYGETEADAPVAVRGMIGSFADANLPITEENKSDILYIAQNKLWNCEDLVGVGLDVVANRAYIVMSGVPTYAEYQEAQTSNPAPRRRVTLGKDATQTATGVDNLNVSETPLKVMIDGQLYIIRGDKMYDATGRLVK